MEIYANIEGQLDMPKTQPTITIRDATREKRISRKEVVGRGRKESNSPWTKRGDHSRGRGFHRGYQSHEGYGYWLSFSEDEQQF